MLAEPITDKAIHAATWTAYKDTLFPTTDKAAKDVSRFYFRSPDLVMLRRNGKTIPVVRPQPKVVVSPWKGHAEKVTGNNALSRAKRYLAKVKAAVEGQSGDHTTYHGLLHRGPWLRPHRRAGPRGASGVEQRVLPSLGRARVGREDLPCSSVRPGGVRLSAHPSPAQGPEGQGHMVGISRPRCLRTDPGTSLRHLACSDGTEAIYQVDENNEATALATLTPLESLITKAMQGRYGTEHTPNTGLVQRSIDLWRRTTEPMPDEPLLVTFGPGADLLAHHEQRPAGIPPAGTDSSVSPTLPTPKKRGLNWDLA